MSFDLGPYFTTFVTLVRRLFASGTSREVAQAPDDAIVTLHLVASDGAGLALTCSAAGEEQFAGQLFTASDALPSGYPAALPFVPAAPVFVPRAEVLVPLAWAVWFAPTDPIALAKQLNDVSLEAGWLTSPAQPAPDGSRGGFALHSGRNARFIVYLPIEEEAAVMLVESRIPEEAT